MASDLQTQPRRYKDEEIPKMPELPTVPSDAPEPVVVDPSQVPLGERDRRSTSRYERAVQ